MRLDTRTEAWHKVARICTSIDTSGIALPELQLDSRSEDSTDDYSAGSIVPCLRTQGFDRALHQSSLWSNPPVADRRHFHAAPLFSPDIGRL